MSDDRSGRSKLISLAANNLKAVLTDGLGLRKGDSACILTQADAAFKEVAVAFQAAAQSLGVRIQSEEYDRNELLMTEPPSLNRWITYAKEHAGTIFVSEWSPETSGARLRSLKKMADEANSRGVASMPGATLADLAACQLDFDEISKTCLALFAVLAHKSHCYVITRHPKDSSNSVLLHIPIDENYAPIVSTGKITPGMWGNSPSGETFILPREFKCHGQVFVDGSLPRRPLHSGEWCLLTIRKGRIESPVIASSPDLQDYANRLFFTQTGKVNHSNSNAVAELGVGANRGILRLTGNPLFDEKKLGTIHLGIGSNSQFDGPIHSKTHHDLVTSTSTLVVGDSVPVSEGQFMLDLVTAYRPLSSLRGRGLPTLLKWGKTPFTKQLTSDQPSFDYVIDPMKVGVWYITYTTTRGPKVHRQVIKKNEMKLVDALYAQLPSTHDGNVPTSNILARLHGPRKHLATSVLTGMIQCGILEEAE